MNHKRVARVMREHGLAIKGRRKFQPPRGNEQNVAVFPNLYRNVIPDQPDRVWVTDITYIRIVAGFCFLAAILDACSRKVVGYAISGSIDTQLTIAALCAAARNRSPTPGTCIHHSDRGCQYSSQLYREQLERLGLVGSMSSPGNPYHNAQAESFMKTLKVQNVYLAGYRTFEEKWRRDCRASSRTYTTPRGCTRLLATSPPTISRKNSLGKRLKFPARNGPVGGVHSNDPQKWVNIGSVRTAWAQLLPGLLPDDISVDRAPRYVELSAGGARSGRLCSSHSLRGQWRWDCKSDFVSMRAIHSSLRICTNAAPQTGSKVVSS